MTRPTGSVFRTGFEAAYAYGFVQPVSLKGVPQYALVGALVTPLSAAMSSPTVCVITYTGAVGVATAITIPYEEPAIRNSSGGFVKDSTFTLA